MNRIVRGCMPAMITVALILQGGVALAEDQGPRVSSEPNRSTEDRMSGQAVRDNPEVGPEAQAAAERACENAKDQRGCERKTTEQLTSKPTVPTPDDGMAREDTSHGAGGY